MHSVFRRLSASIDTSQFSPFSGEGISLALGYVLLLSILTIGCVLACVLMVTRAVQSTPQVITRAGRRVVPLLRRKA